MAMILRCTQKLLKELRLPPVEPEPAGELFGWHANLLRVERRKCALITHDATLFSLFVPGLKRADFDHFDELFVQELLRVMIWCGFPKESVRRMLALGRSVVYAKSDSRSVLGSMNDMARLIDFDIYDRGGLAHTDLRWLHQRINQIPFKAIDYHYPVERMRALLGEEAIPG